MNYYLKDLEPGADCIIEQFASIGENDKVLIITDRPILAEALCLSIINYFNQNYNKSPSVNVILLPRSIRPIEELNDSIKHCILNADIIFTLITLEEKEGFLSQEIINLADKQGERKIFHMISADEEMFKKGKSLSLTKDQLSKMCNDTEKIAIVLSLASKVNITASPFETDIEFDLGNTDNAAIISTGIVKKGSWGNLPSGEAFIIPKGFRPGPDKIVIDCAMKYLGPITNPIYLLVNNGIVCGEKNHKDFDKIINDYCLKAEEKGFDKSNVKRICEFGIGTNPNIKKASDSFIEIEKIYGTCHIAIGDNRGFGGNIKAPCHIDMVICNPKITIDDSYTIMENGNIKENIIQSYFDKDYQSYDKIIINNFNYNVKILKDKYKLIDNKLYRFWIDKRKNDYQQQIGCNDTAILSAKFIETFGSYLSLKAYDSYKKIKNDINGESDDEKVQKYYKLISLLENYGILKIYEL